MVIKNNNLVFNAKVSLTCLFAFNYLSAQNPRPWCLHKIQGHGAPEVKRLVKTNSQGGHFLEKGLAGRVLILTFRVTHARATGNAGVTGNQLGSKPQP